jgi:CCR4-NOT complex subunit CAF16
MANRNSSDGELAPSIDVNNLSYAFPDGSTGLESVSLHLPPGSRTLLIGGSNAQHALYPYLSNSEL